MRRILQSSLLAVIIAVSVMPSGIAHAADGTTFITGYVLKAGAPLQGVTVIASCGRYFADADVTDATGAYLTSLPITECGWGSDVELLAVSSTVTGTARGRADKVSDKLNIANTTILAGF